MRMNALSIVVCSALAVTSFQLRGQSDLELELQAKFDSANTFYERGEYASALEIYEDILSVSNHFASEYNAGNAAYKLSNIGSARIHYERALEMNPSHNDLNSNLELLIANRLNDQIQPVPSIGFKKKILSLFGSANFSGWLWLATIFWTIGWVLFIVCMMNWMHSGRNLQAITGSIFVMIGALGMLAAYACFQDGESPNKVVIISPEANVYTSPDEDSYRQSPLHEGTLGYLIQRQDGWDEIKLENGNKGWIRSEDAEDV